MTDYTKCTVSVLRSRLKDLGLPSSGIKTVLIARLIAAEQIQTLADQSAASTVIPETTNHEKRKMVEEDVTGILPGESSGSSLKRFKVTNEDTESKDPSIPSTSIFDSSEANPTPTKPHEKHVGLSTNKHSVKSRNRREKIAQKGGVALIIDKAKSADNNAISVSKSKLRKTNAWQIATPQGRKELEKEDKEKVIKKRQAKGILAATKAKELGWGDIGGAFTVMDDGNPAWEDVPSFEMPEDIVRSEDIANGSKPVHVEFSVLKDAAIAAAKAAKDNLDSMLRLKWQRKWGLAYRGFRRKVRDLNTRGWEALVIDAIKSALRELELDVCSRGRVPSSEKTVNAWINSRGSMARAGRRSKRGRRWMRVLKDWSRPITSWIKEQDELYSKAPMSVYDRVHMSERGLKLFDWLTTRTLENIKPPSEFFTATEKQIWRNRSAWFRVDRPVMPLPGPAEWWVEEEDKAGLDILATDMRRKEAFDLIFSREMGDRFQLVYPLDNELRLIEDSPWARELLTRAI